MISDLPDLEDVAGREYDQGGNFDRGGLDHAPPLKLQKYLRQNGPMYAEAGMGGYGTSFGPQNQAPQQAIGINNSIGEGIAPGIDQGIGFQGQGVYQPKEMYVPPMSCLDIANHIQGCPICSKFYKDDKTPYIIAIALLAIICILLLKRILNV